MLRHKPKHCQHVDQNRSQFHGKSTSFRKASVQRYSLPTAQTRIKDDSKGIYRRMLKSRRLLSKFNVFIIDVLLMPTPQDCRLVLLRISMEVVESSYDDISLMNPVAPWKNTIELGGSTGLIRRIVQALHFLDILLLERELLC